MAGEGSANFDNPQEINPGEGMINPLGEKREGHSHNPIKPIENLLLNPESERAYLLTGSSSTWIFKDVIPEVERIKGLGVNTGKTEEEIGATDTYFRDLRDRREALIKKARDTKLLEIIDKETTTTIKSLDYGFIGSTEAKEKMDKARADPDIPTEPPDLEGVLDYYLALQKENISDYVNRERKVSTPVTPKDIPSVLDEQISEWERLRRFPHAEEEGRITKLIAQLPQGEKIQFHGKEITVDELQGYMTARLTFLRLWFLSNNENGGANPEDMAKIYQQLKKEYFPLLVEFTTTEDGRGVEDVFTYYLKRYHLEDVLLQDFIKKINAEHKTGTISDDQYDKKLKAFFGLMTIGAEPETLKALRKIAISGDRTVDPKDPKKLTDKEKAIIDRLEADCIAKGVDPSYLTKLVAIEQSLITEFDTQKFGELAERIGFEFVHMEFSPLFDRGIVTKKERSYRFPNGERFSKILFGNAPYANRFIDHLWEFMSAEGRGRPEINSYYHDLSQLIRTERIDRELFGLISDDNPEVDSTMARPKPGQSWKDFFDEQLAKDGGVSLELHKIHWGEIIKNPKNELGQDPFFVVYDDREKAAAMRTAIQNFFQGPDKATFLDVIKNFRSSKAEIRDEFVNKFARRFIHFMRRENKAVFDLKNWDTSNTEKFVHDLKEAHLLDSRDAGAILREELGVNFIPVPSVAWALYTPLKRWMPNSPITRSYERFLHHPVMEFLEKIHIPGWGWIRNIRKTGDWKAFLGAIWAGVAKGSSETYKAIQRDMGGGRH